MNVIEFAAFRLSLDERVVRYRGEIVPLAPKAVQVLAELASSPNEVVSKRRLMDAVWPDEAVEEGNLTQIVFRLRRTFERCGSSVRIETVPRRGFRLVVPSSNPLTRADLAGLPASPRFALSIAAAIAALLVLLALVSGHKPNTEGPLLVQRGYTTWFHAKSTGDVERSIADFRSALHVAPQNAYAHAGLSFALLSRAWRETDETRSAVDMRAALVEAHRALAIDDTSSEAHAALGQVDVAFGDVAQAQAELSRAVKLDPSSVEAQTWLGELLLSQAHENEAVAHLQAAQSQNSSWTEPSDALALIQYLQRRNTQAQALATQALTLAPDDRFARFVRALSESVTDPALAVNDARMLARAGPETAVGAYALLAYVELGNGHSMSAAAHLAAARRIIGREGDVSDPLALISIAGALAREHRNVDAIAWLERLSFTQRQIYANDARLDELRRDPDFVRWLKAAS